MHSTMLKDKICLALDDSPELAEKLSRLEAGDTITGTFTATLDEAKDGVAMLSIEKIQVGAKPKADAKKSKAVKVFAEQEESEEVTSETTPE